MLYVTRMRIWEGRLQIRSWLRKVWAECKETSFPASFPDRRSKLTKPIQGLREAVPLPTLLCTFAMLSREIKRFRRN